MKWQAQDPPRIFSVGVNQSIEIRDHGDIFLEPDGQVTFVTQSGARHDFAAKDWGFYATPSLNGRLAGEGFKTALVQNDSGRIYIMVVEIGKLHLFERYCQVENQILLEWLDERNGSEE
jgi:hypothetical protein